MSVSYLPNVAPQNNNTQQARRRINDLVSSVNDAIGSISGNSGDLGSLQTQVNAITQGLTPNSNANGGYVSLGSYTLSWGTVSIPPTTTNSATGSVTYPKAYGSTPNPVVGLVGYAKGTLPDPNTAYAVNPTTTGFGVVVACAVPTGGGGSTVDNTVVVSWFAIGT